MIIISTEDEHLGGRDIFRNATDGGAKGTERSLDQSDSAADDPTMGIAICELIDRKRRLAKIRENRMHRRSDLRRELPEFLKHGFAANDCRIGYSGDRFGDLLLPGAQPERAFPRRTEGIKLMKNSQETVPTARADFAQDRHKRERHAAFLIAVVHVMQDHVRKIILRQR